MNKYSDKSDVEINKAVAEKLDKPFSLNGELVFVKVNILSGIVPYSTIFDPCNNPADAMPIIIENNISLHAPRLREGWMSEYTGSDDDVNDGFQADYFDAHNKNPYRAAMEVFLMMKDAENEKI
ncbi:phage protein NinX family protein [Morganella morganii]|uniref:phage protein NinX family protein n=1 Tax=Morganella morganii TaxID=582 RepID=UPI00189C12F2|nr:phage protein NinX family protein [Morganella morganii]